jgi:hypothetical protein
MKEFWHGLIFGFGFAIAIGIVAVVSFFFIPWGEHAAGESAMMAEEMMEEFRSVEEVKILEHEKLIRGDDVVVLGRIKNEGETTKSNYALEVELFDKDKKFVELCRESYFGSIRPGEERNFKVTCGGCQQKPVPEHTSYAIRITE